MTAPVHRAFRFRVAEIAADLVYATEKGVLDLDLLHDFAWRAIAAPGPAQRDLLDLVRFQPDRWLWRGAGEEPHLWILLMLSGGASVATVPALSRTRRDGFPLLRQVLELWGWSRWRIDLLVGGRPLDTLLSELHFAARPDWVRGFATLPGWLDMMHAVAFLQELQVAMRDTTRLAAARDAIAEACGRRGENPAVVLQSVLEDAQAMLLAGSRAEALLLGVFD